MNSQRSASKSGAGRSNEWGRCWILDSMGVGFLTVCKHGHWTGNARQILFMVRTG